MTTAPAAPTTPAIERIFTAPRKGTALVEHRAVHAVAGAGLTTDHHFGHREPGAQVTLIEAEEIEGFMDRHSRRHDLALTRRNLVTRGVRLNALVGQVFQVGTVRLKGIELCEPCRTLGQILQSDILTPAEVIKDLLHRGGLRAQVLTSGEIAVGAVVIAGADATRAPRPREAAAS